MNKLWTTHEQLMNKSQTKCGQVVHANTILLINDTIQLPNKENLEENKHVFNFMRHIMPKLIKYIIQTFFCLKSGYWMKQVFLQLQGILGDPEDLLTAVPKKI